MFLLTLPSRIFVRKFYPWGWIFNLLEVIKTKWDSRQRKRFFYMEAQRRSRDQVPGASPGGKALEAQRFTHIFKRTKISIYETDFFSSGFLLLLLPYFSWTFTVFMYMKSQWHHKNLFVYLFFVDMDRGDQDLYMGTKYSIIHL